MPQDLITKDWSLANTGSGYWPGVIRQQAITLANIDCDLPPKLQYKAHQIPKT